jgi:hypothetical protein
MTTNTKHLATALEVIGLSKENATSVIRRIESGETRTQDGKASSHARAIALSVRALAGKRNDAKIEAVAILLDHFESVLRTIEAIERPTPASKPAKAKAKASKPAKVATPAPVAPAKVQDKNTQILALIAELLNA